MPESKSRKKPAKAAKRQAQEARTMKVSDGNPRWLVPTMLGLMLIGLAWIVVFYLSGSHQFPIPALGAWNLGVGGVLIIAGFVLTTRWK